MRLAALVLLIPTVALADRVAPSKAEPLPTNELSGPVAAPRPMPARQASPEVARQGKLVAGSWTCKGNRPQPDGSSAPLFAKLTVKLDLDSAWINTQWFELGAKLADYRTFDDTSKQWTRFLLEGDGAHEMLTSLGEKSGEWLWEGTQSSATGTVQVRHHEKLAGKQLDLLGEMLLGGTWTKIYTASCKR